MCLRKQWEPSGLPRAVFMGCASVASLNIHFTSHAIMHKSQWKCSVSVLLLFLSDTSPRMRKSCVAACQTGCVCVCVCAVPEQSAQVGGALSVGVKHSWSMNHEGESSRQGATCYWSDCWSILTFLPHVCQRKTSRISAAARADASVWENAAAGSLTPPRWDI